MGDKPASRRNKPSWTTTNEINGTVHHYTDPRGWQIKMERLHRELQLWYRAYISTPEGTPALTMDMQLSLAQARREAENRVAQTLRPNQRPRDQTQDQAQTAPPF